MENSKNSTSITKDIRLTKKTADLLAFRVLYSLYQEGVLGSIPKKFLWRGFHALRKKAHDSFTVSETSITPIMSRVLYGISACYKPRAILCVGSYLGNSLLWLIGPSFFDHKSKEIKGYGIDINQHAIKIAQKNFHNISCDSNVSFIHADGHDVPKLIHQKFDLVFLDVEDKEKGKMMYASILKNIYPLIRSGGLVLAHDVSVPKFKKDLKAYLKTVHDKTLFKSSVYLGIDYCGLEVSKKLIISH